MMVRSRMPFGSSSRSWSRGAGRFRRWSSGTVISPTGRSSKPRRRPRKRSSTAAIPLGRGVMLPPEPPVRSSYAAAFAAALIDPDRGTPAVVAGPNGKAAVKRYNVYRNNVTVSLIDALAAVYPAVQRITGVEFFRAMARFHIRATPPTSPLLFEYGRDFPSFIETYEYAQPMPWLADIARVERAWLDAYHAADMLPLAGPELAAIPPEALANAVFEPHPATRIV